MRVDLGRSPDMPAGLTGVRVVRSVRELAFVYVPCAADRTVQQHRNGVQGRQFFIDEFHAAPVPHSRRKRSSLIVSIMHWSLRWL